MNVGILQERIPEMRSCKWYREAQQVNTGITKTTLLNKNRERTLGGILAGYCDSLVSMEPKTAYMLCGLAVIGIRASRWCAWWCHTRHALFWKFEGDAIYVTALAMSALFVKRRSWVCLCKVHCIAGRGYRSQEHQHGCKKVTDNLQKYCDMY